MRSSTSFIWTPKQPIHLFSRGGMPARQEAQNRWFFFRRAVEFPPAPTMHPSTSPPTATTRCSSTARVSAAARYVVPPRSALRHLRPRPVFKSRRQCARGIGAYLRRRCRLLRIAQGTAPQDVWGWRPVGRGRSADRLEQDSAAQRHRLARPAKRCMGARRAPHQQQPRIHRGSRRPQVARALDHGRFRRWRLGLGARTQIGKRSLGLKPARSN